MCTAHCFFHFAYICSYTSFVATKPLSLPPPSLHPSPSTPQKNTKEDWFRFGNEEKKKSALHYFSDRIAREERMLGLKSTSPRSSRGSSILDCYTVIRCSLVDSNFSKVPSKTSSHSTPSRRRRRTNGHLKKEEDSDIDSDDDDLNGVDKESKTIEDGDIVTFGCTFCLAFSHSVVFVFSSLTSPP